MKNPAFEILTTIFSRQRENFKYDWQTEIKNLDSVTQERVKSELQGLGPVEVLLQNPEITEILVNAYNLIFYEISGGLYRCDDRFFSEQTYASAIERLAQNCGTYLCREKPFIEAQFNHLRITIIFGEISRGYPILSIRVQPKMHWTLQTLQKVNFISEPQIFLLQNILAQKKNFVVIGNTGSGKTSFLQAILEELITERNIIIEDTQELHLPNPLSVSLLTRQDPGQTVGDISMDDLIRRALRLRPDRLIIGEIRGSEAKSLLMALATGHNGSMGSLHARSAPEAMLRLEMLIQMGAPQWSLTSIRKLIVMTIQYIFVLEKKEGTRKLKEIYEISSLEETGLTFTKIECADAIF